MKYLKTILTYFVYIVVGFLLIVVYFKNNKITKLKAELELKPKIEIEYVPRIVRDTIRDSIPRPYEVIKWKKGDPVEVHDSIYLPSELGWEDTIAIAEAYSKLYERYASTKFYDEVLKDDTAAYISLKEKVQFNSIFDRELTYENRTSVKQITHTVLSMSTRSFVMGMGSDGTRIRVGAGWITRKNAFYNINYDPINREVSGAVYLPVFNF